MITASMDSDPSGAAKARAMAVGLLDAHTWVAPTDVQEKRAPK